MDCLWSQGTDFKFTESNEPKKPQRYVTKATLPRWRDYMSIKPKSKVSDEKEVFDVIEQIAKG